MGNVGDAGEEKSKRRVRGNINVKRRREKTDLNRIVKIIQVY